MAIHRSLHCWKRSRSIQRMESFNHGKLYMALHCLLLRIWSFCGFHLLQVNFMIENTSYAQESEYYMSRHLEMWINLISWTIVFFSKYSTLKLGATNDEPEYNFVSWFVMLFACGISNGIFQYSVYGPIHNYTKRNRFFANPMLPDNELAQMSILQTMFHFGNYDYISSVPTVNFTFKQL